MRYLKHLDSHLWITDPKHPDSPYGTAWFHDTTLPGGFNASDLPNRRYIFEFKLARAENDKGLRALEIELLAEQ
jgi:hypothetical protein